MIAFLRLSLCAMLLLPGAATLARAPSPPVTEGATYDQHPAAMAFATDLAERRNLDPSWVRTQIGQARRLDRAIRLVMPPPQGTTEELGRVPGPIHRTPTSAGRASFLADPPRGAGQGRGHLRRAR